MSTIHIKGPYISLSTKCLLAVQMYLKSFCLFLYSVNIYSGQLIGENLGQRICYFCSDFPFEHNENSQPRKDRCIQIITNNTFTAMTNSRSPFPSGSFYMTVSKQSPLLLNTFRGRIETLEALNPSGLYY